MLLATLLAAMVVQDEPTFDGETWSHPKEGVKFRVPKGYTVVHDREQLKELGDKMLCVGANDTQDIILFLVKESSEESLDEKAWIEKWEKSWKEKITEQNPDVKTPFRKDGQSKRKSGLPGGDYVIYLDGKERKALTSYLARGKECLILMVLGRSGGDWLKDRDDCNAIVDGFEGKGGGGSGSTLSADGTVFTSGDYGVTFSVAKGAVTLSIDPEQLKQGEDENQKILCMGAGSSDEILLYVTAFKKIEKGTPLRDYRESVEKSMDANYNSQKGGGYKKVGGTSIGKNTDRGDYDIQNRAQDYRAIAIYHVQGDHYLMLMVMVNKSKWLAHRDTAEAIAKSFRSSR